jgi:hypothetical protein
MKYTVVWTAVAERRLTQLWLGSRKRRAIRDAADRMDAALRQDPNECGESRDGNRRVMLIWPLGVFFDVDGDRRQVRVLSVWDY